MQFLHAFNGNFFQAKINHGLLHGGPKIIPWIEFEIYRLIIFILGCKLGLHFAFDFILSVPLYYFVYSTILYAYAIA